MKAGRDRLSERTRDGRQGGLGPQVHAGCRVASATRSRSIAAGDTTSVTMRTSRACTATLRNIVHDVDRGRLRL